MKQVLLFKKSFWAFLLLLGAGSLSTAQTTVQIGTGNSYTTSTIYSPVYRFSATSTTTSAQSNSLFTAAEMSAAGITAGSTITALGFNKGTAANFVTPATYTIMMANSSKTPPLSGTIASEWSSILSTHTVVYTDNNFNIPNVTGWVTINLTTPFIYTGGSLEIATDLVMAGNGGATGNFTWEYTTGFATSIIGAATGNSNLSTYKQRPNTRFTFTTPLSVDILGINAKKQGGNVVVSWDVAAEQRMEMYEIERSTDCITFEKLGSVKAEGDSKLASYSFVDEDISSHISAPKLFYRIKSIDRAGVFSFTKITAVHLDGNNSFMVDAFPSPVVDILTLRVSGMEGAKAEITICDATGKLIRSFMMKASEETINFSDLQTGFYLLKYSDETNSQILKINKQ